MSANRVDHHLVNEKDVSQTPIITQLRIGPTPDSRPKAPGTLQGSFPQ